MRVTRDMIAPELRTIGRVGNVLVGGGKRTEAQLRKQDPLILRLLGRMTPKGVDVAVRRLARTDGTELEVLVVTRSDSTATDRPGILWLHGGGYSTGTARGELLAAKSVFAVTDAVIVAPECRRSKEEPYPAALDDCYQALVWLKEHADELGVRSDQLIVAGGSAGGGLTAATTLRARETGAVKIAFQMPFYPMIDDRPTPSSIDNDAPIYDSVTNDANWRIYLGDLYGTDRIPVTAVPARETDYRGLPPTITFVGSIEPFRDETVAYVENLRAASVPVEFLEVDGAWHAFDGLAGWTKIAKKTAAWKNDRFREYLAKHRAPQVP